MERLSPELRGCFVRLLELLTTPENIKAIAPLVIQEIFYRVLTGSQGDMFRQVVSRKGPTRQVLCAIDWLRLHYEQPLRIGALAQRAKMSQASLFRHFKHLTAMSPLQYQKQVRLQEARTRLVVHGENATSVAYAVGYNSPSQFSREYRRFYGVSPSHDADRVSSFIAQTS